MTRFLVVGDATMDVTVVPHQRLRDGGDVPALIRMGPGGQGANVAVGLARLGADVTLAAAIAPDATGRLLRDALLGEGVHLHAAAAVRSSTVVVLLDTGGERSMLSDRQPVDAAAVADALPAATWAHVSAYALLGAEEGDPLATVLAGRPPHARLSIAGGSIPPDVATAGGLRARLAVSRPDLLVASRDEAAALLQEPAAPSPPDAAARLADLAPIVVVTAGADGSAAAAAGEMVQVAAAIEDGPVIDTTGSGDAYVAALLWDLASGSWPPTADLLRRAMQAGGEAGSRTARRLGAQAAP